MKLLQAIKHAIVPTYKLSIKPYQGSFDTRLYRQIELLMMIDKKVTLVSSKQLHMTYNLFANDLIAEGIAKGHIRMIDRYYQVSPEFINACNEMEIIRL